jgi:hypothetical protein
LFSPREKTNKRERSAESNKEEHEKGSPDIQETADSGYSYLHSGRYIYVFRYLHDGMQDGPCYDAYRGTRPHGTCCGLLSVIEYFFAIDGLARVAELADALA